MNYKKWKDANRTTIADTSATSESVKTFKVKDVEDYEQSTQSSTALDRSVYFAPVEEVCKDLATRDTKFTEKVYVSCSSNKAAMLSDVIIGEDKHDALAAINSQYRIPPFLRKAREVSSSDILNYNYVGDLSDEVFIVVLKQPVIDITTDEAKNLNPNDLTKALDQFGELSFVTGTQRWKSRQHVPSNLRLEDWDNADALYEPTSIPGVSLDWERYCIVFDKGIYSKATKNLNSRTRRGSSKYKNEADNTRKTVLHDLISDLEVELTNFGAQYKNDGSSFLVDGSPWAHNPLKFICNGTRDGMVHTLCSIHSVHKGWLPFLPARYQVKLKKILTNWADRVAENFDEAFSDKWYLTDAQLTKAQLEGVSRYADTWWFAKQYRTNLRAKSALLGASFLCRMSDGKIDLCKLVDKVFLLDKEDLTRQLDKLKQEKLDEQRKRKQEQRKEQRKQKR